MNIVTFCPYGSYSEEAGLLFLLGSYLKAEQHGVTHLQCNGAFSVCERDEKVGWKRSLESCSLCMGEQAALARLGGLDLIELSRYLASDDVMRTKRLVSAFSKEDLAESEYEGMSLFSICLPAFKKMFDRESPNFLHRHHEPALRAFYLSIVRAHIAARKVCRVHQPDLVLVAEGTDILTNPVLRALECEKVDSVTLKWQKQDNTIRLFRRSSSESLDIGFFVEAISLIQMSREKWPSEVLDQVTKVMHYLGLSGIKSTPPGKLSFL